MEDEKQMKILLHSGECPFNYQCKDVDCIKCMNIYMEEKDHGEKQL